MMRVAATVATHEQVNRMDDGSLECVVVDARGLDVGACDAAIDAVLALGHTPGGAK
jgi:hypothetical protein